MPPESEKKRNPELKKWLLEVNPELAKYFREADEWWALRRSRPSDEAPATSELARSPGSGSTTLFSDNDLSANPALPGAPSQQRVAAQSEPQDPADVSEADWATYRTNVNSLAAAPPLDQSNLPKQGRTSGPSSKYKSAYEGNVSGIQDEDEDEEEDDEELGEYEEKLMAALKKLKGAKDTTYEFIVCDAKPHCGVMVAKRITSKHKAELTKITGSKRFLRVGTCQFQDGKYRFTMEDQVSGLARKLQAAIKNFTGKKLPLLVGDESAEDDDEGEQLTGLKVDGQCGPKTIAAISPSAALPDVGATSPSPQPKTVLADKRPGSPVNGAVAASGAASAALMDGLDAKSQRAINDETDRIFYETQKFPANKKIPSRSHEMAPIWLAIRDGVMKGLSSDPSDPGQPPRPEVEQAQQPQREDHEALVETYMKKVLKLKDEEIDRLLLYTDNNAMAEDKGGEKGAERLLEALSGKSSLGKLSDEAKKALVHEFALKWLYSPSDKEDGARENLTKVTAGLKADDKTANMAAEAFNSIQASVPRNTFVGTNYDDLEEERRIQGALWDAAIDLDPMGTTKTNKDGEKIAIRLLGQTEWSWIPGSRWEGNPDRYGQREPKPTEDRRNAVVNSVARGALSDKETDKFFDRMFNSSSDFDVSPQDSIFGTAFDYDTSSGHEQQSMGKLLGRVANQAHSKTEEDAKFNDANMIEIMKSKGGREVLFSTTMPNEYRLWALDMMSADSAIPGKKPWTAKDLARGWESPVVAEAYAGAAVKQAEESFPEPWKVDATKDRGTLTNAVGQLLHIRPDKLPKKENDQEKQKREAEGFNHSIYDEDEDPMKQLLGHIGSGNVMVTSIPVTVMNREDGAALFQVLRTQKDEKSPPFFLDDKGNKYDTVAKWKADNKLPPGAMTYPKELTLGNPLETARTPKDSKGSRAAALGDKAAMAVGAVAGVVILVGSGGAAAPLLAGAAAAYSGTRAVQKLADMNSLGHDLTDLHDDEIRGAYIDVASNAFAVGSLGSAKLIGSMTAEGAKISRAGANLIAGLTWAGNLADAAGLADQINTLASQWDKMDEGERSKALISLGFSIGMKAAAVKKGGGLRDQFDLKRIRNQIEHGTPFSVEKAQQGDLKPGETIAVKNENGKLRIVYEGAYPPKEMLALHSDAAVSMEASYTLKAKLKRMMGKADVDKPPAGSVAWEAVEELKKIRAELEGNLSKMNGADEKTRRELTARQVELNEAIMKENAKLDYWDQPGRGAVASPAKGADQAKQLGWDKAELPEGYSWVAGDGEPHLFAPGKEKLYYNPRTKTFITEAKRARLEMIADRAEGAWFDKTFDTQSKKPAGPLVPDETITATKGKMPDALEPGMTKAQHAEELSAMLGLEAEQMEGLTEVMGKRLSKDFGGAWKRATAKSPPATEALNKIKVRENLAAAAERAGDTKRAEELRKQASKLGKEAYDPVRGEFWKEVYADKKMRAQIEAAGLTFEDGKAPYLQVPDPEHPGKFIPMQITLEHFERKTDAPLKAQDANNLLFSFRYENTVLLEHIRRIVRKQMGVNPGKPHPMN